MLSAPPIVVELDGKPRCVDRQQLRNLVESGRVTTETITWDLHAATLGAWRENNCVPIRLTWLGPLIERFGAATRN